MTARESDDIIQWEYDDKIMQKVDIEIYNEVSFKLNSLFGEPEITIKSETDRRLKNHNKKEKT